MKAFKLYGKKVENDYDGSGHSVLIVKNEQPLHLIYVRDSSENEDIDVMELLQEYGHDVNQLRDSGHNIYFGMASSYEFVVLNTIL